MYDPLAVTEIKKHVLAHLRGRHVALTAVPPVDLAAIIVQVIVETVDAHYTVPLVGYALQNAPQSVTPEPDELMPPPTPTVIDGVNAAWLRHA